MTDWLAKHASNIALGVLLGIEPVSVVVGATIWLVTGNKSAAIITAGTMIVIGIIASMLVVPPFYLRRRTQP